MVPKEENSVFPFPRHEVRRGVVGDFPADLRINGTSDPCDFVLVDVTTRGFGLVVQQGIKIGDEVEFHWREGTALPGPILFKVLWAEALEDFLKLNTNQKYFRVGLLLVTGCDDLLELCRQLPQLNVEL